MSRAVSRLYEFGPFLLNLERRVLTRDHQVVPFAPKTFDRDIRAERDLDDVVDAIRRQRPDLLNQITTVHHVMRRSRRLVVLA